MQGSIFVARISLSPLIPTCTMESPSSCLSALSRSSSSLLCGGCDLSAQIVPRHILLVILLALGASQLSLFSFLFPSLFHSLVLANVVLHFSSSDSTPSNLDQISLP